MRLPDVVESRCDTLSHMTHIEDSTSHVDLVRDAQSGAVRPFEGSAGHVPRTVVVDGPRPRWFRRFVAVARWR
jgi:hypothetical protein